MSIPNTIMKSPIGQKKSIKLTTSMSKISVGKGGDSTLSINEELPGSPESSDEAGSNIVETT